MSNRNKEHYPDPTASKAIKAADRMPEDVEEFIRLTKQFAKLVDMEITNRIHIKYKGKIYR